MSMMVDSVPITDHVAIAGIMSPDMKWITFFIESADFLATK
jgi:hypothetical protein